MNSKIFHNELGFRLVHYSDLSLIVLPVSVCLCKQTTEFFNPFNEQPEFPALQGEIHELKNLKQESSLNKQKYLN